MFMLILPQEPDESTYFNEWWKSGDAVWRYRLTGKFYVTEMVIYAMCREIAFCWTQMGPSCTLKTLKECCLHQLLGGTRDRLGDACFNPVTWGVLVYFSRHLILQSWGWKNLAPHLCGEEMDQSTSLQILEPLEFYRRETRQRDCCAHLIHCTQSHLHPSLFYSV